MSRGQPPLSGGGEPGGRLEQLDQVAVRVGEQDLAPAGAGDHVAAKGQARAAEPLDLCVEVVDDEVDAVAACGGGLVGGGASAGAGGSGEQQPERAANHIGEGGCGTAVEGEAEGGGGEVDRGPGVGGEGPGAGGLVSCAGRGGQAG